MDGAAWKAVTARDRSAAGPPSARQKIADRIVKCDALSGNSKRTVIVTLGRPTDRGEDGYWFYDLGPERGFGGLDNEQLALHFGVHGHVDRAEILTF